VIYTPTISRFDYTPGIPIVDRTSHTADLVRSGKVFIAGGYTWTPAWVFHASYEYYNGPPGEKTFVPGEGLLNYSRAMHRSTSLDNDDVLITGGASLDPMLPELSICEIFTYTQ